MTGYVVGGQIFLVYFSANRTRSFELVSHALYTLSDANQRGPESV